MKNNKSSPPCTQITMRRRDKIITSSWQALPELSSVTHTQTLEQISNVKFVQELNIFPVFGSKESELLHETHSAIEQNLLQVTTFYVNIRNLIKLVACQIKKNCMTTEHNNFLTVSSKEGAPLYQTAQAC